MKRHIAILLPLALLSCRSPVRSEEREELGPELPDVEPGEFHRPGQPCLRCHDSQGGQEPEMVVAGTIFATPDDKTPVANATVIVVDKLEEFRNVTTNCVGNFYITRDEWENPAFPLRTSLTCPDGGGGVMDTLIHRDGACAGCHEGFPDVDSPGWLYCYDSGASPVTADPNCPGRVP